MKKPLWCLGMLTILLSVAGAGTAFGWTYLGDLAHTGRVPGHLELPLILQWRFDTEAAAPAVSTPTVDEEQVYFVAVAQPAAPAYNTGMGMAPGMPGAAPGAMPMPGTVPGGMPGATSSAPKKSVLYAVDRQTGAERWKLDTDVQITSALLVDEGIVYFGADDGKLWAVNAATGHKKWRFEAQKAIRSAPALVDRIMYFGSDDGRVYAFDLETNERLWQFETGGPVQCTPAVYRGIVYIASQDQYLYALRRSNGTQVWRQTLSSSQVYGSPMVERDKVIVAAGTHLIALDARYGDRRWVFTAGDLITGTAAAAGRRVFVGSRDGVVYAINDLTGRAIWRYPADQAGAPVSSAPLLVGDTVIVRCGERRIVALDQAQGQLRWAYTLPKPPETYPAAYGGYGVGGGAAPGGMPGGMPLAGGAGFPGAAMPGVGTQQYWWQPSNYEDVVCSGIIADGEEAFVVGDDGALYGFSAQAADNLKPEVAETVLELQIRQTPYAYQLRAVSTSSLTPPPGKDDVLQTPGAPPIWLHAEITDAGAGINPETLQVLLDGQPVPPEQQLYEPKKALIWWIYDPQALAAVNLPDGLHCLSLRAADWLGNEDESQAYFFVDNSLSAPKLPGQPAYPAYPGMPGAPGYGPGMPPGGPTFPGVAPLPPMMY